MPQVVHSTSENLTSVWHIDAKALQELQDTIDELFERMIVEADRSRKNAVEREYNGSIKRMEQLRTTEIDADEKKELRRTATSRIQGQYDYKLPSKQIEIGYGSKALQVETFDEARHHPDFVQQLPTSISLRYHVGRYKIDLSMPGFSTYDLRIDTAPLNDDLAREALTRVARWADQQRLPTPYMVWNFFAAGKYVALFFVIMWSLNIYRTATAPRAPDIRHDARELLANGITDANQNEAIEAILSILSNVNPRLPVAREDTPWGAYTVIVCLIAVYVAAYYCVPSTTIGLGLGEKSIYWQRKRLKFVTYVVPVIIGGGIVLNIVGSFAVDLIKRTLGWA